MTVTWLPGPPTTRGHYWIAWRRADTYIVVPVAVEPAVIYRNDPNAKLLMHLLGGYSYDFERNAPNITHHALLVCPEGP
jgi:hypothetical protein